MTHAIGPSWSEALAKRQETARSVSEKQAFWRQVWFFATINFALWLSWVIGGLRDEWVAPWPIVPTALWGLYLLYKEFRLGGHKAVSHDTMNREIDDLRHPSGPVYQDRLARRRPIEYGDATAYPPLPEFHLRDVIDARERKSQDAIS